MNCEDKKYLILASALLCIFIFISIANLFLGKYSISKLSDSKKEKRNLESSLKEIKKDNKNLTYKLSLIDREGYIDIDLLEELVQKKLSKIPKESYILKD